MDVIEVRLLFKLFWTDKFIQYTFSILITFLVFFTLFVGLMHGLLLLLSLVAGFYTFCSIFRFRNEVDNILNLFISINKPVKNVTKDDSIESVACSVCGEGTCDRDRITYSTKPWSELKIPEDIDLAITDLLNKTLDEFLISWYKDFSSDTSFPQEIKESIRYAASVVLSRGFKVDLVRIVTDKVLAEFVRHAEWFRNLTQGRQFPVHPAMHSRESELAYLRCLVTKIMPFIVPHTELHCKNFSILIREVLSGWLLLPMADTVSDPIVLNSLLINLGRQPLTQYSQPQEDNNVEFLAQFVSKDKTTNDVVSALHPEMSTILKDQNLLYAFMQFLKNQGTVHILQFCLDVEEFNRRMLIPELSSEELDLLYRDAWDLYSLYFSPHSPDAIDFPSSLVTQMRKVLSKDVTKLRTSPPLFQAYEYAYGLLDSIYCPKFHNCDDFYTWLCGPRIPCNMNNSGSSSPSLPGSPAKSSSRIDRRRQDSNRGVSRLSSRLHKIKGALKAQPVLEGQAYDIDTNLDLETDTEFAEALQFETETERDLSAWRVSIPSLTSHIDPSTNKISMYFNITVKRIDVTQGDSSQWSVERRLTDFYSLDAKLTEFHGEFTDAQLPPRRLLTSSSVSTTRSETTQVYEEYLQKLLSKPALRGSDLLFAFLACPGDFVAEDNTLGRLLRRSVPISLRKERGQNLEPFIATFIASTESRVKNSKIEWKDMSQEMSPRHIRSIKSDIFGNNFGFGDVESPLPSSWTQDMPLNSPTRCFVYCGMHILGWSTTIVRLILALHALIGNTVDAFLRYWLDRKLQSLLVPQRIVHLIRLLQWLYSPNLRTNLNLVLEHILAIIQGAIFESRPSKDRVQVAQNLETMLQETGGWSKTLKLRAYSAVYISLQYPPLNKQLFYCLLDTVIEELFPELQNTEEASKD